MAPVKLVSVKKMFISNRLITRHAISGIIANTNSTRMEGSINKYATRSGLFQYFPPNEGEGDFPLFLPNEREGDFLVFILFNEITSMYCCLLRKQLVDALRRLAQFLLRVVAGHYIFDHGE